MSAGMPSSPEGRPHRDALTRQITVDLCEDLLTNNISKFLSFARVGLTTILIVSFFVFAIQSIHWPWMGDTQIFHYVNFLMSKGMSPYREILDINMPGSYLSDFIGTSIFGRSDMGWRLYDYSLLGVLIASCIFIAATYDWFAGLFAGVLFTLVHGSEGPWQTAQRDEVMTVLLILGYAIAFAGIRQRRSPLFFFSAVSLSFAATLKPTAFVAAFVLGVPAFRHLSTQQTRIWPYMRAVIIGTSFVLLTTLIFLEWRGSFCYFFRGLFTFTSHYTAMNRPSFAYMMQHVVPRWLIILLALAAILSIRNRSWRKWEIQAVVGGVFFGLLSYFAQYKGFPYHRYPFLAFALLWVGLEFVIGLRTPGFTRWVGITGLLTGSLIVAPFYLSQIKRAEQSNALSIALVNDLERLAVHQLQGSIQCLDVVDGCYSALYRLQLKQITGIMGDQLLFSVQPSSAVSGIREEFLRQIESSPPRVFVVTNFWYGESPSFNNLDSWPKFAEFLRNNYTVVSEQTFPKSPTDADVPGYRIYLRSIRLK
jgi:hypothetical protein